MVLDLQPAEAVVLRQTLVHYLSDLRMEITNTEDYELRQELKRNEAIIKSLIVRLPEEVQEASA